MRRKKRGRITALPDQGSPADQRAHADENLWDHIRSVHGRTFHSLPGGRISRERRARMHFLRAGFHLYSRARCSAKGVQIYIGDGATVTRSFIRKRGRALIGHSPVRTQLTWCQKEGVPRAIITHCGSEIVTGNERDIAAKVCATATELGIEVRIAYDGMKVRMCDGSALICASMRSGVRTYRTRSVIVCRKRSTSSGFCNQ